MHTWDRKGTPEFMWLECWIYYAEIINMISLETLGGRNAYEVAFSFSVNISLYIQYEWWEPLYFLDSKDPSFTILKILWYSP